MKKKIFFILIFFIYTFFISSNIIKKTDDIFDKNKNVFIEDEIIVKYKNNISEDDINQINNKFNVKTIKKLTVDKSLKLIKLEKNQSITDLLNKFRDDPNIEFAQPNYIYTINSASEPNDTYFSSQWGLQDTGQTINEIQNLSPFNDIKVYLPGDNNDAWDINTGNSNIIVAVVDTGVDYLHPDLKNNIWKDLSDNCGYDFIDNDNDPMDQNGHGTLISGIIGAVTNNNTGIAGIAWNVKIMCVRGLNANGVGTSLSLSQSINYAVNNGAKIINVSWGNTINDPILKNAIIYAKNNGVLIVAAAGNDGINNDITSTTIYPASYNYTDPATINNVISVAASGPNDELAGFSNYGAVSVHVAAPGVNIISTYCNYSDKISQINLNNQTTTFTEILCLCIIPIIFLKNTKKYLFKKNLKKFFYLIIIFLLLFFTCNLNNTNNNDTKKDNSISINITHSYVFANGTSTAAPFISGIAVLMLTKNQNLMPYEMINYLSNPLNSDMSNSLNNKVLSNGRINARKVLVQVPDL